MRDYARKIPSREKKGDDRFVTLFLALFAPAAALVFLATPTAFDTRDSLAKFVPRGAAAYVHGGGAGADRILASSIDAPAGVRPREAAIFFAVEDDGKLHHALLFGWDAVRRPTPAERQTLADRGASQLGPFAYYIGDGPLETAARAALAGKSSLADDPTARRALASMRGVDTLQAYADPGVLTDPAAAGLLKGTRPVVAAISPTETLTGAVVVPTDVAAAYYPFGFRVPSPELGAGANAVPPLAKTVVSVARPDFDPVGLLFGPTEGRQAAAEAARKTLLAALDAPTQVALFPDAEKRTVSAVLRFPTLPPAMIASAIERYASSAWPERKAFLMPDQDQAVEDTINADRYHFAPQANPVLPGAMSLVMEEPSLQIFLAPDGKKGSLVTADGPLLAQWKGVRSSMNPKECPGAPSPEFILMRDPSTIFANNPQLQQFLALFKAENLKVTVFGDNILVLCGYIE